MSDAVERERERERDKESRRMVYMCEIYCHGHHVNEIYRHHAVHAFV